MLIPKPNRDVRIKTTEVVRIKPLWCGQKLGPCTSRLLKHTDMTIHRKALEEHFLMTTLAFRFIHSQGKDTFSEFFSKNFSPKVLTVNTVSTVYEGQLDMYYSYHHHHFVMIPYFRSIILILFNHVKWHQTV
jgi:hypothetical protein